MLIHFLALHVLNPASLRSDFIPYLFLLLLSHGVPFFCELLSPQFNLLLALLFVLLDDYRFSPELKRRLIDLLVRILTQLGYRKDLLDLLFVICFFRPSVYLLGNAVFIVSIAAKLAFLRVA